MREVGILEGRDDARQRRFSRRCPRLRTLSMSSNSLVPAA